MNPIERTLDRRYEDDQGQSAVGPAFQNRSHVRAHVVGRFIRPEVGAELHDAGEIRW